MPLVVGAFVTSVLIAIVPGSRGADFGAISTLPLWPRTAGIMGAEPFICAAVLIPRIGIGAFFIPAVSGRVIPGMIFGQLGLIGAPQTAIKIGKLAGVVRAVGGAWLTTFKRAGGPEGTGARRDEKGHGADGGLSNAI